MKSLQQTALLLSLANATACGIEQTPAYDPCAPEQLAPQKASDSRDFADAREKLESADESAEVSNVIAIYKEMLRSIPRCDEYHFSRSSSIKSELEVAERKFLELQRLEYEEEERRKAPISIAACEKSKNEDHTWCSPKEEVGVFVPEPGEAPTVVQICPNRNGEGTKIRLDMSGTIGPRLLVASRDPFMYGDTWIGTIDSCAPTHYCVGIQLNQNLTEQTMELTPCRKPNQAQEFQFHSHRGRSTQ